MHRLLPVLLLALTALAFVVATLPSRAALALDCDTDYRAPVWRQFHSPERSGDHSYRWSGSSFTLAIGRFAGQTVLLDLHMASPRPPAAPAAEASLWSGEWQSGPFVVGDHWRRYQLLVPLETGPYSVELHVPPFTPGPADSRRLGVALRDLRLTPVTAAAWSGPLRLLSPGQLGFLALLPLVTYYVTHTLLGAATSGRGREGAFVMLASLAVGVIAIGGVGLVVAAPERSAALLPGLWGLVPLAALGWLPSLARRYPGLRARLGSLNPLAALAASFVVSRVAAYAVGVRFDASSLEHYWQFIDPQLLQTDLARSLFFLHCQPPLFNLFLGTVLKLAPGDGHAVFYAAYLVLSLGLAFALYRLMRRLGMGSRLSLLLTLLFVLSPSAILYESWLMYNYPVAALLCVAALFLHRLLSDWRLRDGLVFFGALAAVCAMISSFHLLWFLVFVALVLWVGRQSWQKVLIAASLPLLLVGAIYGKNLVQHGSFTSSTWFGMSLWRMLAPGLGDAQTEAFIVEGLVSPIVRVATFSELGAYRGLVVSPPPTGIPVLDAERKSTGHNNYNHLAYVVIAKQYAADAVHMLRAHPQVYREGLELAWYFFFTPSSDLPWFYESGNLTRLTYLDRLYNTLLYGQPRYPTGPIYFSRDASHMGLLLIVWYGLALLYGLVAALQTLVLRFPRSRAFTVTVAFLWLNVVYVSLVGTLFEFGENNRYRFMIDPFLLVLVGLAFRDLARAASALARRWRRGVGDRTTRPRRAPG